MAGGEVDINGNMVIASFLDISYALFLAISVAGLANVVTTWTFFAVGLLFNAYGLFKLYKAAARSIACKGDIFPACTKATKGLAQEPAGFDVQRVRSSLAVVGEEVLGLVQGMFISFVVSLSYLASLVVIYNGPNAEVMGNIKNSYFDFAEITNLEDTVRSILLIVAIETATSLATLAILHFKCKINPALVFLHLTKEYGFIISTQLLYWFYLFFCLLESEFTLK